MFDEGIHVQNYSNDSQDAKARPLLKWAGGKSRLLKQLSELMPDGVDRGYAGRLVEPFVGGAAMFLWLKPQRALLGDSNNALIELYWAVKEKPEDLVEALDRYQELPHDQDTFYEQRALEPENPVERAARLIYLNKNCFNGLYRLNKAGKFNVPFGRYKAKPKLYDRDNLFSVSERLQSADLKQASFEETLGDVEPGDFVYLDPPYYPLSSTSSFTGYTGAGFSHQDQVALRDAVYDLHCRTGGEAKIMLSNSIAPALLELYESVDEFRIHRVTAVRAVGAKQSSRGTIEEIAVVNY